MKDLPKGFLEGKILGHSFFIVVILAFCVLLLLSSCNLYILESDNINDYVGYRVVDTIPEFYHDDEGFKKDNIWHYEYIISDTMGKIQTIKIKNKYHIYVPGEIIGEKYSIK